MRVSLPRASVFLFAAALAASACDNGDIPITPAPPTVTETFAGMLSTNGATVYPFIVSAASGGRVTATLNTLDPSTIPIGMSLGTWNGATCSIVVDTPAAIQTSAISGTTSTVASLCLRVYDASGTVPTDTPVNYSVSVVHP
ncbi:MAG TPA: hypothetical protein VHI99_12150 [Vicinamibacterales bacterium]|jgi:hypothetical protein|nr:hypothetical protein [Vicinamibacterales bacterium]